MAGEKDLEMATRYPIRIQKHDFGMTDGGYVNSNGDGWSHLVHSSSQIPIADVPIFSLMDTTAY